MITLTPRGHVPWQLTFAIPILAVVLTIMAGGVIFAILGFEPLETLYEFFIKPLSQPYQFGNLLVKACPLIIIGTGLAANGDGRDAGRCIMGVCASGAEGQVQYQRDTGFADAYLCRRLLS
mgnify:CR=1 FL=1